MRRPSTSLPKNPLCGITSYFNPAGYRRRLIAYKTFRRHLKVPLITVELSPTNDFELTSPDADILIQIHCRDIMFQKERLLNIAIDAAPAECQAIAWFDCDVVFEKPDWAEEALAALENNMLVQPFDRFEEPGPDWSGNGEIPPLIHESRSWAWHRAHGTFPDEYLSGDIRFKGCVAGGAWIARREFLTTHKLYDACIAGSGVRCPVAAGIGGPELAARYLRFGPSWNQHYMGWAEPFHDAVQDRFGYTNGALRHVWHGDLKRRRYASRHASFETYAFDPEQDIVIGDDGAYRWSSDKPEMHRFLRDYFFARREDDEDYSSCP